MFLKYCTSLQVLYAPPLSNASFSTKVKWHTTKFGDPYSEFVLCVQAIQSAHTHSSGCDVTVSPSLTHTMLRPSLSLSLSHTHTFVGFYGLRGLSIGVMVFILYKLYVLLPYTYPTPKLSPHRRRCISTFPKKPHSVWFISVLNYGDTENVFINHLLLVIPPSHTHVIIQICVLINHINMPTHTHTQTHTHKMAKPSIWTVNIKYLN